MGPALEVAIGIVFLYFVLALVCSSINEAISTIFGLRARFLQAGLVNLLSGKSSDGVATLKGIFNSPLLHALIRPGYELGDEVNKASWTDPTRLKQWFKGPRPSPAYIPSRTFVSALTGLAADLQERLADAESAADDLSKAKEKGTPQELTDARRRWKEAADAVEQALEGFPNEQLQNSLLALYRSAGKDAAEFRHATEQWFDDAMERVSGWYKRRVQLFLGIIGALLVLLLNADTLTTGRALWRDEAVRAGVVAQAEAAAQNDQADQDLGQLVKELDVPLGWEWSLGDAPTQFPNDLWSVLAKVFGLALTTAALLLGAGFWFDLLSKIIRVRGTGAPPPVTDSVRKGEGEATRAGPSAPATARG